MLLAIAAFYGFTGRAQQIAQQVITPGDKLIRYDWIRSSHDYYKNVTTDTSGKLMWEFMMDDVTIVDSVHQQILFARSRQVPVGNFFADTSVTDLVLKPLWMHENHEQRHVLFEMSFADTVASVKTVRGGVVSVKDYPMKRGYFEDNMIEYILSYLDLKKGVRYVLDNFNKDTQQPSDPYEVESAFDDIWDVAPGYRVNCSVLHFTHGSTWGYIWIDKRTHQMLKKEGFFKKGTYVITKV